MKFSFERLPHVFLVDVLSFFVVLLTVILFSTGLASTILKISPAAETILSYQAGGMSEEAFTTVLASYESSIRAVFASITLLLVLFFLVLCLLLALFRGMSWSLLKKQELTLKGLLRITLATLYFGIASLLLAVIVLLLVIKTSTVIGAILIFIYVLLFLHFSPFVFSAFNPKIGPFKNFLSVFTKGILVHKYWLFYLLCIAGLVACAILTYLARFIHDVASVIVLLISAYTYWFLARQYHVHITVGRDKKRKIMHKRRA
ncbi:MAG: hypothetical protein V1725_02760 [archaeon]